MLNRVAHLLPVELKAVLERLPESMLEQLEEIRVREGRPLELGFRGQSRFAATDGTLRMSADGAFKPTGDLCRKLLEKITNYSLYAMEEELKRGFITVAGGHRIGLAGRTILDGGNVRGIRDIGAFNIRIAREVVGSANHLLPKLLDRSRKSIHSTLILAPPQQGKTTLIRDIARSVSYGLWGHGEIAGWQGRKVGIVDERSEIAACVRGIPTFDIGPRTDVMDACPKAEGMMMLLRSMSPEVIVADEIGRDEDGEAIREASHAGVSVIATAHAYDVPDALGRPVLRRLLEEGAFSQIVELRRSPSGFMHRIVNAESSFRGPAAREPTLTAAASGAGAAARSFERPSFANGLQRGGAG
ncbi:stage III sporulation protein AA [Paenibacillus sp. NEAU-GSW1]|uniref:stage III sporulation protein AA n=1 Tax=Paenibacillus sp. NEAU-GSW1 TaxID=2682486 RepID=UPI0012E1E9F2|nr:stage III sporulation protein AA [Paenibacillus sp. NEAU-GSW1]MUT66740.1 stage III sporulation protein AA [Paenibacillus sp. NEAU-GSW1]